MLVCRFQSGDVQAWGVVEDGQMVQQSHTSQMLFPVPKLIAFVSSIMTLLPGDIISTGTPKGVGPLKPGDTIEVFVEGVGRLRNPVV